METGLSGQCTVRNTEIIIALCCIVYILRQPDTPFVRFSASGGTIILVSGEVKVIRIFAGKIPREGVKVRHSSVHSENFTNNQP